MSKLIINRRSLLKTGGAASVALATPYFFTRGALAQSDMYLNAPKGDTVTLGFNVFILFCISYDFHTSPGSSQSRVQK